jgi:biotin-[acetyl-CoA-carboxylase] ligase BirA-like protein
MTAAQAFYFDSLDSTNEAAKRLIHDHKIHSPAYVVAREQTAGRGQRGRLWLSPRDAGIYLTVVDFPDSTAAPAPQAFTLGAAHACVEALRQCAGVEVFIKPINDLYVGRRKLGGILTEVVMEGDFIRTLLTGIGINVRIAPRPLPRDAPEPISLQELIPPAQFAYFDGRHLVTEIVRRVLSSNAVVARGDASQVQREWERSRLPDAASVDLRT